MVQMLLCLVVCEVATKLSLFPVCLPIVRVLGEGQYIYALRLRSSE